MQVINMARPFNVGDVLTVRPIGEPAYIKLTVASWRPGIDVHAINGRGQSVTVTWHVAERALDGGTLARWAPGR